MKFLTIQTLLMVSLVTFLFIYEINGIPTATTTINSNNQEQQSKNDGM